MNVNFLCGKCRTATTASACFGQCCQMRTIILKVVSIQNRLLSFNDIIFYSCSYSDKQDLRLLHSLKHICDISCPTKKWLSLTLVNHIFKMSKFLHHWNAHTDNMQCKHAGCVYQRIGTTTYKLYYCNQMFNNLFYFFTHEHSLFTWSLLICK